MANWSASTCGGAATQKELPNAGTHLAVLIEMIELGTQMKIDFTTKKPKAVFQVELTWELAKTKIKEGPSAGKPFVVRRKFTRSLYKTAALLPVLGALQGRPLSADQINHGFDPKSFLGKACLVTVVHTDPNERPDGIVYANVGNVTPLIEGMDVPPVHNPLKLFLIDKPDFAVLQSLPEFRQQVVYGSAEARANGWQAAPSQQANGQQRHPAPPAPVVNDDVPF